MLRILLFAFVVAQSYADLPVTPPPNVFCAEMPPQIFSCIGSPKIVAQDISASCGKYSDCERYKCLFRKSQWLDGDKVNKQKVSAYFDKYAKDNPVWTTAIRVAKSNCLTVDLPAQGAYLNCPTYDTIFCIMTSFLRNAPPSQWNQSSECTQPRQYATSCPFCPGDCFSTQIPYGSCNACLTRPRSP